MSSQHQKIDQQTVTRMVFLTERLEQLNDWEKALLKDRINVFRQYGFGAVITKKQKRVIDRLYQQIYSGEAFAQKELKLKQMLDENTGENNK